MADAANGSMDERASEARAAQRLLSGQSWEDFCDVLKVAGGMIDRFGDDPSDLDRAEWYRFLTRVARSSFERLIENAEPTRPRLRDMVWRQSINVQTVDQDHLMCQFDEARDYRIIGTRGSGPTGNSAALASATVSERATHTKCHAAFSTSLGLTRRCASNCSRQSW